MAEHLATLVEFHRDDDAPDQAADPIESVAINLGNPLLMRLVCQSGRAFVVHVMPERAP